MDAADFKNVLGSVSAEYAFVRSHGAWLKESSECIIVLELQKSNFGNYFELNIKTFIKGAFGRDLKLNKDLSKKLIPDVLRRPPDEFKQVFDLDRQTTIEETTQSIRNLFVNFVVPYCDEALTCAGLKKLEQSGQVFLLPAVKAALG